MAGKIYRGLKNAASRLGVMPFVDEILARMSDRDRRHRQYRELLCQSMFQEFCRIEGIQTHFYPVGGAANYSLMYVLARLCTECPIASVLELGAGQSTMLLSVLSKRKAFDLLSVESSPYWVDVMRARSGSEILHAPLVDIVTDGKPLQAYAEETLPTGRQFDVVLVDGPIGVDQYSRSGCLGLLKKALAEQFVVIFDDAERQGELQTIALVENWLIDSGRSYKKHTIDGMSSQVVLASPKFLAATYF